jgi:hypothetical protein
VISGHDGMFFAQSLLDNYRMIEAEMCKSPKQIIIRSDNAASQFKSRYTISAVANVSSVLGVPIIQTWGVPQRGKDEVDNLGGLVKTTLKKFYAFKNISFFNLDTKVF